MLHHVRKDQMNRLRTEELMKESTDKKVQHISSQSDAKSTNHRKYTPMGACPDHPRIVRLRCTSG